MRLTCFVKLLLNCMFVPSAVPNMTMGQPTRMPGQQPTATPTLTGLLGTPPVEPPSGYQPQGGPQQPQPGGGMQQGQPVMGQNMGPGGQMGPRMPQQGPQGPGPKGPIWKGELHWPDKATVPQQHANMNRIGCSVTPWQANATVRIKNHPQFGFRAVHK